MSDPAAKESRAMAQTDHRVDLKALPFQLLSVMEVSFFINCAQ
jgi:hypothetical protein